ncbi:MAG: hypothetical protein P8Y60_06220, partial [Calditrichota bacterium]
QLTQPVTISSSTDRKNYKPSLVQKPNGYDIQVCWIRNKMGDSGAPYWINAMSWESNNSNVYRIYGHGMFARFLPMSVTTTPRFILPGRKPNILAAIHPKIAWLKVQA